MILVFKCLVDFGFQLLGLWSKVAVDFGFQRLVDFGFQLLGLWSKVAVDFYLQWLVDFAFPLLGLWSQYVAPRTCFKTNLILTCRPQTILYLALTLLSGQEILAEESRLTIPGRGLLAPHAENS